jgi:hypothetical protein
VASKEIGAMDSKVLEIAIEAHLKEMSGRLEEAAGIARAADACADTGNLPKAIEIALDLEQILYEVNTFLNAASMMHRIWKT